MKSWFFSVQTSSIVYSLWVF
uniref:Uncharacterized protein n=1 Tax=Rhizophora mucronata TaxID=61149 RepID=A0A2P2ME35_RHIMU